MKLSVQERLMLLGILPKQGDIITLRIVRDLEGELSFSEEEHKAAELTQKEQRIEWKVEIEKDVPIGPKAHSIIADTLEGLNKQKTLALECLPLYERFCENDEED